MLCVVSIHAARAGGDAGLPVFDQRHFVSIHAARAGGDAVHAKIVAAAKVSIHAARACRRARVSGPVC
jgi:hypothetical protein